MRTLFKMPGSRFLALTRFNHVMALRTPNGGVERRAVLDWSEALAQKPSFDCDVLQSRAFAPTRS